MISKEYIGTYNGELLIEQLFTAFPEWQPIPGPMPGILVPPFDIYWKIDGTGLDLFVPDGTDWARVDAVLAAHNPSLPTQAEIRIAKLGASRAGLISIPGWATYTADEARDAISTGVLNGMTKAQYDAWVDANVTTANLATLKASLKQIGEELIDLRDMTAKLAMLVAYLRDLNE